MANRRLLLADDSATIQKVVNLTFADEGIEVISVGDGDAAIASIAQSRPDVVLADVHMPGLSGYQVCERIRQDEATRDLPVVLLVGSFEPFDAAEATRVGANAHLTKPFQSIKTLVDQVTGLINTGVDVPETEREMNGPDTHTEDLTIKPKVDTSDIDNLVAASFAEKAEISPTPEPASEFVDAGMDDEIIETTYSSEQASSAPDNDLERQRAEEEPLELSNANPASETFAGRGDTVDEFEETVAFDLLEEPVAPISPFETLAEHQEQVTADEPVSFQETPYENVQQTPEPKFDDLELLELPPSSSGERLELTGPPVSPDSGNTSRVVSLSPELMEIIVQKVVERLSEKE